MRLLNLIFLFITFAPQFGVAQDESCYKVFLQKCVEALNQGDYFGARNQIAAAKICEDLPQPDTAYYWDNQIMLLDALKDSFFLVEMDVKQLKLDGLEHKLNKNYKGAILLFKEGISKIDSINRPQALNLKLKMPTERLIELRKILLDEEQLVIKAQEEEQELQKELRRRDSLRTVFESLLAKGDSLSQLDSVDYIRVFKNYRRAVAVGRSIREEHKAWIKINLFREEIEQCLRENCFGTNNFSDTYLTLAETNLLLQEVINLQDLPDSERKDFNNLARKNVNTALKRNSNYHPNEKKYERSNNLINEFYDNYYGDFEIYLVTGFRKNSLTINTIWEFNYGFDDLAVQNCSLHETEQDEYYYFPAELCGVEELTEFQFSRKEGIVNKLDLGNRFPPPLEFGIGFNNRFNRLLTSIEINYWGLKNYEGAIPINYEFSFGEDNPFFYNRLLQIGLRNLNHFSFPLAIKREIFDDDFKKNQIRKRKFNPYVSVGVTPSLLSFEYKYAWPGLSSPDWQNASRFSLTFFGGLGGRVKVFNKNYIFIEGYFETTIGGKSVRDERINLDYTERAGFKLFEFQARDFLYNTVDGITDESLVDVTWAHARPSLRLGYVYRFGNVQKIQL